MLGRRSSPSRIMRVMLAVANVFHGFYALLLTHALPSVSVAPAAKDIVGLHFSQGEHAMESALISLLSAQLPSVFRWAGALARQLRGHDIALGGKNSGFANTDALTLADLSVQELLVAALRDMGPTVRQCRIEAEEASGDLGRFADESEWVLGIDPIDGTREYRDRTGDGYAVMLHARTPETVHYSLVYLLGGGHGRDLARGAR